MNNKNNLEQVYFFKYKFLINKFVLRPRSDSELLVEFVINELGSKFSTMLDLGTGSGCLVCSILMQCPYVIATAIDLCKHAMEICLFNIKNLNLQERITLLRNNWLNDYNHSHDLLISNPPYVTQEEITQYKLYDDPLMSLLGGISFYKRIYDKKHLFKYMILEINPKDLLQLEKLFNIKKVIFDYVQLPRFIFIENNSL